MRGRNGNFCTNCVFNVTGQNGFVSIEGLFNQMAKEVPAFSGLTWAAWATRGRDDSAYDWIDQSARA